MIPMEYIVGAGALVGVTLYIIFGGELSYSFSDCTSNGSSLSAPGLMNLGQTCFFNAVLQALASCQTFCDWMEKESAANSKHCQKTLCDLLRRIICDLKGSSGRCDVADTRVLAQLLDEIRGHGWVVENSEQHDAHELFQAIMNLLHSAADKSDALKALASLEGRQSVGGETAVHKCKIDQPTVKLLKSPMSGYIANSMTCKTCLRKSAVKYTEFTSLSLHFPPAEHHRAYQLQDLLNYYFLSDNVTEVECENCSSRCGVAVRRDFVMEQSIGRMPKCLCLHVQRLGWYGYHEALKRHDRVTFPANLEITNYTQLHRIISSSRNRLSNMSKSGTKTRYHGSECQNSNGTIFVPLVDPSTKKEKKTLSDLTEKIAAKERAESGLTPSLADQTVTIETDSEHSDCVKADTIVDHVDNDESATSLSSLHTPLCSSNRADSVHHTASSIRSWYTLVSMIEHRGSEVSGHFVTYRKVDRDKGKWIYTSDLDVSEVSAEYVHSRSPYMLFYERMSV